MGRWSISHGVITGASSGIGEEFARQLAARGTDLALLARREERLRALADELADRYGIRTEVMVADLTDAAARQEVEAYLADPGRSTDLLVNNAGFGSYGAFHELDADDQAAIVELNVTAVVRLTRAVLPVLVARDGGGVINVGSLAGFQPDPYGATYGASKAFVASFSEAVAEELADTAVRMMVLAPGHTRTGFQDNTGFERDGWSAAGAMTVEAVVRAGLRDFTRGRVVCVPGVVNRLTSWGAQLAPSLITRRISKRAHEELTGRV